MLSVIGFNSCSDSFLETTPTTDIPIEEYFTSEERLMGSLMAAYQPLLWHDWAFGQYNPLMIQGDIMGEDIFPGGADEKDNEHWHRMRNFNATSDYVPSGLWTVCYSGINRANIVIANKDIDGVDTDIIKTAYGEALTLRAYYYSILWKYWGNIPYYTVNPSSKPYLIDQIKADEVYDNIIKDLDEVIDNNLLPESYTSGTYKVYGRMTRAAAQMLRANIVTYQNDESRYNAVLTDMKEIIDSGRYSLYSNFAELWEVDGEWCSESILEVNYTDKPSARTWGNPLGTGGSVTPQLIGINGLSGSSEFKAGWGFGTVSPVVYDLYDDEDQRKDGGILNIEKHKIDNPSVSYSPRYQDTGLFLRKYLPRKDGNANATGDIDLNYNNNYRIYRFAETLLLAAELTVRTGGSQTDADKYLNMVRARAYKMNIDDAAFAQYKRVATLDNILEEYRLEFVGEGHRFWDLVRFGKAEQVLGNRGYTATKKHLPIPRGEIDKAQGTLTQNPY